MDEVFVSHLPDYTFANHSLYVSSDNSSWTTLINNETIVENANGKKISAY